jgi:GNAT superfamily N-acetyltransferase
MIPQRMLGEDDPTALLALIRESFAYMEGRIDPPSSMTRLTPDSICEHLGKGEIWTLGAPTAPEACIFLTPDPPALYLGKLAVAATARRKGYGRALVTHAETRARTLGFDRITLQSRIELTENHTAFRHLGFTKIAVTAHPGYTRPTSITFEKRLQVFPV